MGRSKKQRSSLLSSSSEVADPIEVSTHSENHSPATGDKRLGKRSVSYQGTRRSNPFSILPDEDSDRGGDSDDDKQSRQRVRSIEDKTYMNPSDKQATRNRAGSGSRRSSQVIAQKDWRDSLQLPRHSISSESLSSLSNLITQRTSAFIRDAGFNTNVLESSARGASQAFGFDSNNIITSGSNTTHRNTLNRDDDDDVSDVMSSISCKSKKSKKKNKKLQPTSLRMYDSEESKTQLPSRDEINEIMHHLKEARTKIFQASLRFWAYVAVKMLAFTVIIIQLFLLAFKFLWLIISNIFYYAMRIIFSAFPFLNSWLLHSHDRRDPFKRQVIVETNSHQQQPLSPQHQFREDEQEERRKKKKYSLAMDLDDMLAYIIPVPVQQKKQVEKDREEGEFVRVFHPSQKQEQVFKVIRRPYLDIFLLEMSKLFNLVIFSSNQQQYVDAVIDSIDENRLIVKRLYREHCIKCPGIYIKDIQHVGDIKSSIIVDTVAEATKLDSENALIVKKFHGEENDQELLTLLKMLTFISNNAEKTGIPISSALHDFKNTYL